MRCTPAKASGVFPLCAQYREVVHPQDNLIADRPERHQQILRAGLDKPLRKPITPSPARASPQPVSEADSVTNQVPCRSRDSHLRGQNVHRFPPPAPRRFQASTVVGAPAKAIPLRCIGFFQNFDLTTLCRSFNDASG